MIVWVLVGAVAVVVAVTVDPKWVLAPLLGLVVFKVGTSTLRGLAVSSAHGPEDAGPTPIPERTLYWCGGCGAELLLVRSGASSAPRHCGERMHERVELPRA